MAVDGSYGSANSASGAGASGRRVFFACLLGLFVLLVLNILVYEFGVGGRHKTRANKSLSPWDMSAAPPQFLHPNNVKVKLLPPSKREPPKALKVKYNWGDDSAGYRNEYGGESRRHRHGWRRSYRTRHHYSSANRRGSVNSGSGPSVSSESAPSEGYY